MHVLYPFYIARLSPFAFCILRLCLGGLRGAVRAGVVVGLGRGSLPCIRDFLVVMSFCDFFVMMSLCEVGVPCL